LMIRSMARWMRFIGAVKVVSGLATAFLVLVGLIYVGAELRTRLASLGKAGRLVSENQVVFFALGAFALILAAVGTALGFVLYHAADDFDQVVLRRSSAVSHHPSSPEHLLDDRAVADDR